MSPRLFPAVMPFCADSTSSFLSFSNRASFCSGGTYENALKQNSRTLEISDCDTLPAVSASTVP